MVTYRFAIRPPTFASTGTPPCPSALPLLLPCPPNSAWFFRSLVSPVKTQVDLVWLGGGPYPPPFRVAIGGDRLLRCWRGLTGLSQQRRCLSTCQQVAPARARDFTAPFHAGVPPSS